MSKETPILSISDLTVVKKRRKPFSIFKSGNETQSHTGFLVKNMNLILHRNQIHGIVGESGSGKSLTMKCVLGLIDFSPGIISGHIQFIYKDKPIQVLPEHDLNVDHGPWYSWIKGMSYNKNSLDRTEYYNVTPNESAIKLDFIPILDSIQVFFIDDDAICIPTDFVPPTKLNKRLIRLQQDVKENQMIGVSYRYISSYSSATLKKRIDKIQHNANIRGHRISMILQDPQTFLNPLWSIEKQLKNIIERQRSRVKDSLYLERNFTLRVTGSKKDFPLTLKWDRDNISRHLRQADIWMDGKSHSMRATSEISIKKGSSHFWGMRMAGRIFSLSIHPGKNKEKIGIKWDNQRLEKNVSEATLMVQSRGEKENINLLTDDAYFINPNAINSQGLIQAEIEFITKGGDEFEQTFDVNQGLDNCTLIIGLKTGATAGIDTSLGEKQIATPVDEFYAGLIINNEENKDVLSHRDIRSPVDLYTAEATVTITPKFDLAYIGNIKIYTASGKHRHVEFGLLSSATNEEDDHLGEKDITTSVHEGIFEAGFVIEQEGNAIMSPKDLRNLEAGVDIDKEVSSILAKVDLNDEDQVFRRQYPKEISGGQGQRVMISLAMAAKPEVLIADEPTNGLDVTKQTEVVQLFQQYKDQGRTIVLISHDLSFVSHLADYYTIMYAGTDVEHIPNDKMEQTVLLHPYTRRLLEIASCEEEKGFTYIEKDVPDPYRSNLSGCPFEPRCKLKENIPISLDNEHICKQLFPPIIHADSGGIIQTDQLDGKSHFIRCWLFLKT
ncbi:MAG: ATP-binding cassette domain-containing protein [Candidatus Marinimicrobia bacterium]|nr:ATP-binding cassette domain-containing protein [Candidatus Neomarinimicrobiota bacterium]MBL7109341.1 ATP-binding cassette domain-containing protein [Candidatus Neomarinimicrobiota bacterium]